MLTIAMIALACIAGVVGIAIWFTRRHDGTVINRMGSTDRVDGSKDPHAHLPHSHI